MELAFSLIVDALSDCGLITADNLERNELAFSRVEIYAGQPIENDVLYVTEGTIPIANAKAAYLVASSAEVPKGAIASTANASAIEVMNTVSRYVARLSACIAKIEESCRDGNLRNLCQALADFVRNPVVIYDDTMSPLAQTDFPRAYALDLFGAEEIDVEFVFRAVPDWEPAEDIDISSYPRAFRTVNIHNNSLNTTMCGIMFDEHAQGFLEIFSASKPITEGDMAVLERACKAATQLLPLRSTSFIESSLVGKPLQGPRASVWLSALQWRADDELYVCAIDLSESYGENRYARKVTEQTLRSLLPNSDYTTMDGTSIVVANTRFAKRPEAIQKVAKLFAPSREIASIGVSDLVTGVAELHIGYEHARFAAGQSRRLNPAETTLTTFEQCRFSYLASLCDFGQNADFIRDGKVKRMHDDDCAAGAENTLTIKTYIETGLNLNATAKRLNVHRNTVAYRLKQIAERYGIDLSSPVNDSDLIFQTLLSCKILLGDK